MSKGIPLGNISGSSGTLTHSVSNYFASRYSLFVDGDLGGGTLNIQGGEGTTFEAVYLTDVILGGHTALQITTNPGLYTFTALCSELRFALSGASGADIDLTLFPEPRPA